MTAKFTRPASLDSTSGTDFIQEATIYKDTVNADVTIHRDFINNNTNDGGRDILNYITEVIMHTKLEILILKRHFSHQLAWRACTNRLIVICRNDLLNTEVTKGFIYINTMQGDLWDISDGLNGSAGREQLEWLE